MDAPLGGLFVNVAIEPDLRDPARMNLRVVLENNSADVGKRRRHRFEHAIHQVRLTVEMPAAIHRSLRLDRVEPSYRFRDFLTYAAIGVNCGVTETRAGDRLLLATTWMPRYVQPRIVPEQIDGVPTRFESLSRDGFNPGSLRAFVDAYESWIQAQEAGVDPAHGAETSEDADRERETFRQDIASYRREAARVALGIDLLEHSFAAFSKDSASREAAPYKAWLLVNKTFAASGQSRGIEDWRLFQLAFVLAHIPTLASRMPQYNRSPWFDPAFDEETATELQTRAKDYLARIEAEHDEKRKELGVADELKDVPGVTTPMLVKFGENDIKSVEDLAGAATDDLVGWTERKDGETKRFPGILDGFELSREEAEAIIMQARLKAGWITEADLAPKAAAEEIAEETAGA